jgi:hypothetical protein
MKTTLLLLPALALAACVSAGPKSAIGTEQKANEKQRLQLERRSDCMFRSTIDDFTALDNSHVVLFNSGRRKAYLLELEGACFDIRSQPAIATVDGDNNGQICGYGRDSVAYRGMGRVDQCRILGIEALSDARREALGLGAAPKPKPKPKDAKEEKPGDEDAPPPAK